MSEDFFYAFITGWAILAIFWLIIVTFILIRKPPKSRLTNNKIAYSIFFFLGLLLIIISIRYYRFVFL